MNSFNVKDNHHWRNFGITFGFIIFNVSCWYDSTPFLGHSYRFDRSLQSTSSRISSVSRRATFLVSSLGASPRLLDGSNCINHWPLVYRTLSRPTYDSNVGLLSVTTSRFPLVMYRLSLHWISAVMLSMIYHNPNYMHRSIAVCINTIAVVKQCVRRANVQMIRRRRLQQQEKGDSARETQ